MFTNPGFTLADQLSGIVELFRKALWADPRTRGLGALSVAIWQRVRGFERRFSRLYAMWKAGTLPPARPAAVTGVDRGAGSEARRAGDGLSAVDVARMRPASMLPGAFRWLQGMLPNSAATLAAGVGSLCWNYPEMAEFHAACPRVGRILRPMCRMAGLKPPAWLALPNRGRVSRGDGATAPPPPHPSPVKGEGERRRRRTPREVAEAAIARSERTGKPIDPRKIGAVAFGYVLHWPRDGNCPPPEIGYGGRWRRPPKDYKPPGDGE